jgi:hypothetical protein
MINAVDILLILLFVIFVILIIGFLEEWLFDWSGKFLNGKLTKPIIDKIRKGKHGKKKSRNKK